MKKALFLPFLLLFGAVSILAQPTQKERKKEKIEAYRVAFITARLNLTASEAEKFWPVYNEFADARERIREEFKMDKDLDVLSDAEVEDALSKHLEGEQKELDLKKESIQKLRKVLPARKVVKLQMIEREFKAEILKKIKENRKNERGGPPPAGRG